MNTGPGFLILTSVLVFQIAAWLPPAAPPPGRPARSWTVLLVGTLSAVVVGWLLWRGWDLSRTALSPGFQVAPWLSDICALPALAALGAAAGRIAWRAARDRPDGAAVLFADIDLAATLGAAVGLAAMSAAMAAALALDDSGGNLGFGVVFGLILAAAWAAALRIGPRGASPRPLRQLAGLLILILLLTAGFALPAALMTSSVLAGATAILAFPWLLIVTGVVIARALLRRAARERAVAR